MDLDSMIRSIKYTADKHRNDVVGFGGTNISLMCDDIGLKLQDIKNANEEVITICKDLADVSEEYRPEFNKIIDIIKRGEN